jgi:hypothetical protein
MRWGNFEGDVFLPVYLSLIPVYIFRLNFAMDYRVNVFLSLSLCLFVPITALNSVIAALTCK